MRLLLLLGSLVVSCIAFAQVAGLAGTYVMESPGGTFVARFDVKGSLLTGTIDIAGQPLLRLSGAAKGNHSRGTIVSKDGNGEYEAVVQGDLLTLTISQQEGPNQRAASMAFQFQRADAAAAASPPAPAPPRPAQNDGAAGDQRLVGHWVYQEILGGGGASLTSEEHLVFRSDGNYAYGKGRTVGGGADWSYDSGGGGDVERGRWRAASGVLFVLGQNGQWARIGTYGMTDDGNAMRITYDGGGRKLWSRQ
jgi:hypothetical protein